MSLETDLLIDRRHLKRRLLFWRVAAVVAVAACALVVAGPHVPLLNRAHLARLTVTGIIAENRDLTEAIEALVKDDTVRGLIVDVDSPGGTVTGGETLHQAIAKVAARKPVVTVMGSTAASAAYMIAVPAARIYARDSTLTGSIGVLLQTGEISGLLEKIGVTAETFVSGPLKNQPSPTHPTSPQGREVLQGLVTDMYDQFVGMVAAGRHMPAEQVRKLADGRPYTGRQALGLGRVDAIGGEPEARAWLAAEKGIPESLPVEDVEIAGFARRALSASFGPVFDGALKSVLSQRLSLDGAWAVWQPAGGGD